MEDDTPNGADVDATDAAAVTDDDDEAEAAVGEEGASEEPEGALSKAAEEELATASDGVDAEPLADTEAADAADDALMANTEIEREKDAGYCSAAPRQSRTKGPRSRPSSR